MTGRRAAGIGLAAVASALLFVSLGTTGEFPRPARHEMNLSGDFRSYYYPNARYLAARLERGEIPLWSPYHGAGGPFLATVQVGVLYPPNWLHVLLPTQTAFLVLAALHVALAAAGAGAFAAALGAGTLGSATAGLAYATSFQLVSNIWLPPAHYAMAWAPWALLAVDRALVRPSPRAAAALAAATALLFLAGRPYIAAMAGVAAAVYTAIALAVALGRSRRAPWRPALALALGAAGAALLVAPQLLPTLELLARSVRALGSVVEAQAVFVSKPHDPAFFARFLARRGFNDGIPGVVALLWVVPALTLPARPRARLLGLLAAGGVGLLASFPRDLPVYGWLRELPVLADFRFPYRYRVLPTLAIAVAAGVGVTRLGALRPGGTGRRPGFAVVVGVVALLLCAATQSVPVLRTVPAFSRTPPPPRDVAGRLAALGAGPPAWGRLYWTAHAHKHGAEDGIRAVHDLEPMTLARTAQLLTFFESGRPRTLITLPAVRRRPGDAVAAPFYGHLVLPEKGAARAPILDHFSVTLLATDDPPTWLHQRYRRVSEDGAPTAVFANPHALPRAYRVPRALPEPTRLFDALQLLVAPAFDPRRAALVDRPPRALLPGQGPPGPRDPGSVRITRDEPEHIVLATRGDAPGLVVLTDAHYPGWEARVDGERTSLLRANLAFRGVAVPPGPHEIELRYRPRSWRLGLVLALAGALGCAAAALWRPRRD